MPVKINYNGNDIASVGGGNKATLNCKGKLMEDIVLVDASGINEKDSDTLVQLIERTLTEIEDDRVKEVGAYAFNGYSTIESISFPNATKAGIYCCYSARNLTHANLPKATTIGSYAFADANLSYFDTPATIIYTKTFRNNSNLKHLFLRRSDDICTLQNVDAFGGTIFDGSVSEMCYIYVPRNLLETYQSATNWSSFGTAFWHAIEDYTVDGTLTGEIDWRKVNGELISFTIDDPLYWAEDGMTWAEWCDSRFNTDGFYINGDNLLVTADNKVVSYVGSDVTGNNTVYSDGIYFTY